MSREFADWLTEQMEARGLQAKQVALGAHVSASTVSQHLRGASVDLGSLAGYAEYFGVDLEILKKIERWSPVRRQKKARRGRTQRGSTTEGQGAGLAAGRDLSPVYRENEGLLATLPPSLAAKLRALRPRLDEEALRDVIRLQIESTRSDLEARSRDQPADPERGGAGSGGSEARETSA